jgi:hypothetical protein
LRQQCIDARDQIGRIDCHVACSAGSAGRRTPFAGCTALALILEISIRMSVNLARMIVAARRNRGRHFNPPDL